MISNKNIFILSILIFVQKNIWLETVEFLTKSMPVVGQIFNFLPSFQDSLWCLLKRFASNKRKWFLFTNKTLGPSFSILRKKKFLCEWRKWLTLQKRKIIFLNQHKDFETKTKKIKMTKKLNKRL